MLTKHAKHVGILAMVTTLTTAVVVGGGLWWILSQGGALIERAQLVADYETQAQALNQLENLLTETTDERAALATFTLTEGDTIDFLATIESMARQQGTTLVTDALNVETIKEANFNTLHVTVTVSGYEASVVTVLDALEHLPYSSWVEGVDIRYGEIPARGNTPAVPGDTQATIRLAVSILKS